MTAAPHLTDFQAVFGDEDPLVFILAPSRERAIPAGDTRRRTVYLFRDGELAATFSQWLLGRHRITTVPVLVRLRALMQALAPRDLTYLVDPQPRFGYGNPQMFRGPLVE
jgi:hypothetical protein